MRGLLGEVGQAHQDQRADQRHQPQQWVDQVADQQVDRRPGRIEEGEQAVAGQKLAHLRKVLQGLGRVAAGAAQVAFEGSAEDASVEVHVEEVADPDQYAGADHLQGRHQHEQADYQQGEHGQGGDVAADQGAVVHLQHINSWRQHHDVYHAAEGGQGVEAAAQAKQHVGQFGAGAWWLRHRRPPFITKREALAAPRTTAVVASWSARRRVALMAILPKRCVAPTDSSVGCNETSSNIISLYKYFELFISCRKTVSCIALSSAEIFLTKY
ncbi:hypothetical protein D3C79_594430 [compost metagenome]